jgi:hypothetical protein
MADDATAAAPAAPEAPTAAAPAAPEAPTAPDPKTPAAADPTKTMTAADKKIFKLKVKDKEIEFDASDEERVKKAIQKGLGADEAFTSAAEMRKQAETFLGMLKDPKSLRKVLTDPRIGIDLKKFAEEYVWEQIQEQQLTPEQKKQRDRDAELQRYKDEEKKGKEEREANENRELQQRFAQDYDQRITSALTAAALPKTPATVKRMAFYMLQAVQNGYELEPGDLVEQVRKDYIEEVQGLFGQTDGDTLLSLLGEDVAKKIRDGDLKRLKSTQGSQFATPAPKPGGGKGREKPKKLDGKAWRDQMIKGYTGK